MPLTARCADDVIDATACTRTAWNAIYRLRPRAHLLCRWRADVLAIDEASSRRVAFEVQLAPMTIADGPSRTERYAADAIRTLWLTTRRAPWLWSLPGCQPVQRKDTPGEALLFDVTRGLAKLVDDEWVLPPPVALARFAAGVLAGSIAAFTIDYVLEDIPHGETSRMISHSNATGLVPAAHLVRARQLANEQDTQGLVARPKDQALSCALRAAARENFAARLAAIWIVSPVAGLRPSRAARSLTLNLPKPAIATARPAASSP